MKKLTDEEIVELLNSSINSAEKDLSIIKLFMFVLITEAVLFLCDMISPLSYLIFVIPCFVFYLFHQYRYKKTVKTIEDIFNQLNEE